MTGQDHADHLQRLSRQLIEATEKRAGLKAELAILKKGRKTDRAGDKRKHLKQEIQLLSQNIERLVAEIARPIPRKIERWAGVIPVRLRVESQGKKYEHLASTLDLSANGLRILTTTALTPGQTLDVYSSRAKIGTCRVVWVSGAGLDRPSEVGLEILT